ncbi:MAG: hypothetical protein GEU73_03620 [Chloroflexi bacterium]|nr:hypothetical protein [Chloroflexota bacterium]
MTADELAIGPMPSTEGLAAPERPIVVEHRQQLMLLLREAAQLEHAIMCQYLFAASSMKEGTGEGLTSVQAEAVGQWRSTLFQVAREEMLHLALVQNLLTDIGAGPMLARPNIPTPPDSFPADVQIALIPFGERALRHFLFLERPEGMPFEDVDGLPAGGHARPLVGDEDIVPLPQHYATVGHLYRAIDIGFAWLTAKLGEDRLFAGPPSAQATEEHFGWPKLIPVVDLDSAHRAVSTIVEQGEGARGDWKDAHFGRFMQVFDELRAVRQVDPDFEPARPVVPGTVRPQVGTDLPVISDPATAQVADLFNVVNEIVLLTMTRFFAHTDETSEQLATLADLPVRLMFQAIRPLGLLLTRLPFGPSHPGATGAPTFELFYSSGYLLPNRHAAWLLLEERLRQTAEFARRIEEAHGIGVGGIAKGLDALAAHLAAQANGGAG